MKDHKDYTEQVDNTGNMDGGYSRRKTRDERRGEKRERKLEKKKAARTAKRDARSSGSESRTSRDESRAAGKAQKAKRPKRFRFDGRFPFIHKVKHRSAYAHHFVRVSGAGRDENRRVLTTNISSALVFGAALSMLLALTDDYMLIPFVIPGVLAFALYASFAERLGKNGRLITTGAVMLLLLAFMLIFWSYLKDGGKLILNDLYAIAEQSQAYVYPRLEPGNAGYNHPDGCMYMAVAWGSTLIGFLLAHLPYGTRRPVNIILFIAAASYVAYYGVVPNWGCIAALTASLLISLCYGRIAPAWPLLLMAVIVFGALILIDPGEIMPVSRANENIRDRFAYKTAYMVDYNEYYDAGYAPEESEDEQEKDNLSLFDKNKMPHLSKKAWVAVISGMVVLIIAIIILIIHLIISRRRNEIRKGIDSDDPVTAVRAMFPYAMRWLRVAGIRISNVPYSDLKPQIEARMPGGYIDRFTEMNDLWQQAAFSDHKITEADIDTMDEFMEDTIDMVRDRLRLRDKLLVRLKYAL